MNIFFHCNFSNKNKWHQEIKKKFKDHRIFSIKDKIEYHKIDFAIIWNLPDEILKKLINIKLIFSLGAGVDHILKLPSYNRTPIIRIKDSNMRKRMFNHALSQILNYQLKLSLYQNAQNKKIWLENVETFLNNEITIGILGVGYIGGFIGKNLKKLNYQIVGYKNSPISKEISFPIFNIAEKNNFIKRSDIIISILPSTNETKDFINKSFLNKMKKKSLLINIGRGNSINEDDLVKHVNAHKNFYISLDVFKKEPLTKNHQFWKHPNITLTPHIAAITDMNSAIEYIHLKLSKYLNGEKIKNDVNLKKGY